MHSIRSLLLVTGAILGFAVLAPSASQATTFTVTKTCTPNPTNSIPGICTISVSSITALNGATIFYYGPTISPQFVSSTVVLKTVAGDTASGYCNVYRAAVPIEGICAFHDGSGALANLEAVAKVTVAPQPPPALAIWSWIGTETHGP